MRLRSECDFKGRYVVPQLTKDSVLVGGLGPARHDFPSETQNDCRFIMLLEVFGQAA